MTKQEEIERAIRDHCIVQASLVSGGEVSLTFANSISKSLPVLLDGLGVVIKVDGEYKYGGYEDAALNLASRGTYMEMLKAGYVAVVPLIKEE